MISLLQYETWNPDHTYPLLKTTLRLKNLKKNLGFFGNSKLLAEQQQQAESKEL